MKKRIRKGKATHGGRRAVFGYEASFRIQAVKLYTEKNYSAKLISEEMGCLPATLQRWIREYRLDGEEDLLFGIAR